MFQPWTKKGEKGKALHNSMWIIFNQNNKIKINVDYKLSGCGCSEGTDIRRCGSYKRDPGLHQFR